MRKQILTMITVVVLFGILFQPFSTRAVTVLDPDAKASLTLHYQKDGVSFSNLQIAIHRVAKAAPDGTFELIPPYESYPLNIHDITRQEQWKNVAATLGAYIIADQLQPDCEELTNEEGIVHFDNLETGLYYVREVVADHREGTYIFNQFMVYLPTPQQDGSYKYEVEAKPKCVGFTPKTQYTVTKLWQDEGNQALRPEEVTVEIYKDGILQETQILKASNNWSYTWYVPDDESGKWTVIERFVPNHYSVTIKENGNVFSLINTCQGKPTIPPQTGDSFSPLPWILAMCISGFFLLILGLYNRRK